jgi:DNA ligase-1
MCECSQQRLRWSLAQCTKSRLLTFPGSRKFFSNPKDPEDKKQQSTLAFHQAPKAKTGEDKIAKPEDNKGHKKNAVPTVPTKGVSSKDAELSDHEGEVTNGAAIKKPSQDSDGSGAELNGKSVKHDLEAPDEEDEEPVRKRPRRSVLQAESRTARRSSTALKGDASPDDKPEKAETPRKNDIKTTPKPQRSQKPKEPAGKSASKTKTPPEVPLSSGKSVTLGEKHGHVTSTAAQTVDNVEKDNSEIEEEEESDEDEKPEVAAKAREKVQSTLKSHGKDPYPDWKAGEPVPYAALCTTFSLIEMTTKRLIISAHCSLFLRQVLRLTPADLLPTVQLMINKLAADYAGIELGIGESLIMKAIGETTGRSLAVIKADQKEIGDLGLVAAKSRGNQPTMFKPKPLTVRNVLNGLMGIATVQGHGAQGRKVDGIKKLLSAADASNKSVDITKDKGGASETKFIIRFLEGKLRLGLAERTVLVALAHAMVIHEMEKTGKKVPSQEQLANGEAILKTVYRLVSSDSSRIQS